MEHEQMHISLPQDRTANLNSPQGAEGNDRLRVVKRTESPGIHEFLHDAPAQAAALVIPEGYTLTTTSTNRLKSFGFNRATGLPVTEPQPIASAPILILGRLRDIETGDEFLRVAWRKDGWHTYDESRATLMNARELVKLAGKGFPVTSGTAGDVSQYLDAFEHANLE